MESLTQSRVASVTTTLLGIWLAVSPVFISITGGALTSLIVVGVVMALAGLVQLFSTNSTPSWLVGLLAIYLFISAFAFNVSNAVTWNEVISAIVAFVLAAWDGIEISTARQHHHAV